jgi:hypothetical protein
LPIQKKYKLIIFRILVVAIPSYTVAFYTEAIFYVVPTIAMMMMIANSAEIRTISNRSRIDENVTEEAADDAALSSDGLSEGNGSF